MSELLSFGEKVKLMRETLELTQTEFGELVGLRQTSVSTVEKGRSYVSMPVLENIKKLAKRKRIKVNF